MNPLSTETLPVLPLPDGVVFPEMVLSVVLQSSEAAEIVDSAPDGRLLLVPRVDGEFASVGVIANIIKDDQPSSGVRSVMIKAHGRAKVGGGVVGSSPGLWVMADPVTPTEPSDETPALVAEYKATAAEMLKLIGGLPLAGALDNEDDPETLADSISYWPELSLERRLELLQTIDVDQRLRMATDWLKESLADQAIKERIRSEVNEGLEQGQKEAILRRQMAAIKTELGEGEDSNDDYRARLESLDLDEATTKAIAREIDRLERAGGESTEANWIRTWLDTVFEVPWNKLSSESVDLSKARSILDADHTGLVEVKERLIEHLAVRKLRAERNDANDRANSDAADGDNRRRRRRSTVLALVGPPGVGKTSLGQSVADALGRNFVRIALGGIRDEAEIRGHRRTYVGSRPGRLVRALIEADSMNPVVLLDEIDKVSGGWQGDPSAALLEVLDPAQNHSFRDNYLEFELDLSDVVFIATANVLDTIPGPLLDRLEVIPIEGYTEAEKATIATEHLLGRLLDDNGLTPEDIEFGPEVISTIAGDYTREAGVRQLERKLDRVLRKSATTIALRDGSNPADEESTTTPLRIDVDDLNELLGQPIPREEVADRIDRPGIATGLAVTGAGGDVLFVETALIDGDGEPLLTGQLGDVMKESATIVSSIVSAQADRLGIKLPENKRLHIHFPAGAVPKDGPSAGVTMTTAVVSLLSGRPVRSDVAMTGEVTLGGKVLPIGGVKQKILAAKRAGITAVALPKANQPDVDDIEDGVIDGIEIHFVSEINELLDLAVSLSEPK